MRKAVWASLSIFLAFLFISPTIILAESNSIKTLPRGQEVAANYFAASDKINLSGTVDGDAYVAGGQILVDGVVKGDLLVAGGTVTITGEIGQNLRIAGGNVIINGKIGRNVTVVSGNTNIGKQAIIAGSVVGAVGNLEYLGQTAKDLVVVGGNTTINGAINGNVDAKTGQLTLGEGGVISGYLNYTSKQEAIFAPNATVSGQVAFTKAAAPEIQLNPKGGLLKLAALWKALSVGVRTVSFISSLILGFIFIRLIPRRLVHAAVAFEKDPWRSLGVGVLIIIVTPILAGIFVFSLIGFPLGLFLFFALAMYLYIGTIWVSYYIGRRVLLRLHIGERRGWAVVSGLVIYFLLTSVPFVGWIVRIVVNVAGVGMIALEKKDLYKTLAAKRLL